MTNRRQAIAQPMARPRVTAPPPVVLLALALPIVTLVSGCARPRASLPGSGTWDLSTALALNAALRDALVAGLPALLLLRVPAVRRGCPALVLAALLLAIEPALALLAGVAPRVAGRRDPGRLARPSSAQGRQPGSCARSTASPAGRRPGPARSSRPPSSPPSSRLRPRSHCGRRRSFGRVTARPRARGHPWGIGVAAWTWVAAAAPGLDRRAPRPPLAAHPRLRGAGAPPAVPGGPVPLPVAVVPSPMARRDGRALRLRQPAPGGRRHGAIALLVAFATVRLRREHLIRARLRAPARPALAPAPGRTARRPNWRRAAPVRHSRESGSVVASAQQPPRCTRSQRCQRRTQ